MDEAHPLEAEEMRLKGERAFLLAQLAQVTRRLSAVKSAIGNLKAQQSAGAPLSPISVQAKQVLAKISRPPKAPLVNELILDILKDSHPEPLRASDIRREALKQYGVEINQNTLTASLARYRSKRAVVLVHKAWLHLPPQRESGWERQNER
jgi:hypothetical protein